MSNKETYQQLPFHEGNLLKALFPFWALPMYNHYKKISPSFERLFQVPDSYRANNILCNLQKAWDIESQKENPSYFLTCIRAYRKDLAISIISLSFCFLIILLTPFTIESISYYISGESDNKAEAFLYAALYSALALTYGLAFQYGLFRVVYTSMKLKAGTGYFIFTKLLKMDHIVCSQKQGELLAGLGADVEIFEASVVIILLPSFFVFMIGAAVVLYILVGYPGLLGLAFILLEMILLHQLNHLLLKAKSKAGEFTDKRLKLTTNIIEGIRIIKLYSWEESYSQQLSQIRQKECRKNIVRGAYDSIAKALNVSGLGISLLIIIGVYKLSDENLETEKLFGAISVLIMAHDLGTRLFAIVFHFFTLLRASAARLTKVIMLQERKDYRNFVESKYALRILDASFSWGQQEKPQENQATEEQESIASKNKFKLSKINIRVRPSELIIVVGEVGSGKTSLLLSILGELELLKGEVLISDKISFATQEPWIIKGTIRQNIIMGKEYDENLFQQVVKVCQLEHDLQQLENSDQTLVGDKGITLSGGQKARVALARAVYQNFEIIAMDDPLSAVDSDVGQKMFFQCINGYLSDKTRILVTHNVQYLQYANRIIVMEKGRVQFFGGYEDYLLFDKEHVHHYGLDNKDQQDSNQNNQTAILNVKQEKNEEINIPFSVYWKYFQYGCYSLIVVLLWILVFIIGQFFYFAVLIWIGYWSDQSSQEQEEEYYMNVLIVIVILATIFGYLRSSWLMTGLLNGSRRLHDAAMSSLIKTTARFFDRNPQGRILVKFTRDVILLDDVMTLVFSEFSNNFGQIIGSLIVIAIINYYSLFVILLEVIFASVLISKSIGIMRQLWNLDLEARGFILAHLGNVVSDLVSVRSLGIEKYMLKEMEQSANLTIRMSVHYSAIMSLFQHVLFLGSTILIIIVIFVLVAVKDEIEDPNLGLILVLSLGVTVNIIFSGWLFAQTGVLMSSVPRLLEYADLPNEEQNEQGESLQIIKGEIQFDNVSMKYKKRGKHVLNELSFTCPAGKKVAIIGRTGAGKSSIMLILMRMYPLAEGRILIDGKDISQVTIKSLRRSVSIIPQTPTIFKVNLRNNLDPLNLYSDQELKDVMAQIKLQDLSLDDMPELSTGQKQLLCLGRAIVQKTKILLLDEATASVDPDTDKFIQKKIKEIYQDCTIISIAHRLRTIINSDYICALSNGQVVEFGTPEELLKDTDSQFLKLIDATGETEAKELKKIVKNRAQLG